MSSKNDLIIKIVEQEEDINLSAIADKRDSDSAKTISHNDAWK